MSSLIKHTFWLVDGGAALVLWWAPPMTMMMMKAIIPGRLFCVLLHCTPYLDILYKYVHIHIY